MFGLEIRKKGQLSNIYSDVNTILKKHNIPEKSITHSLIRDGVAHSLHRMLKSDHWLDITVIDACVKISGIHITSERHLLYRAQHCVNWNEMLKDFREQIIAMILDDFKEVLTYVEGQSDSEEKDITCSISQ